MINVCYCGIEIDEEDRVCCLCVDDTDGRNQHFWKIKDEDSLYNKIIKQGVSYGRNFDVK